MKQRRSCRNITFAMLNARSVQCIRRYLFIDVNKCYKLNKPQRLPGKSVIAWFGRIRGIGNSQYSVPRSAGSVSVCFLLNETNTHAHQPKC